MDTVGLNGGTLCCEMGHVAVTLLATGGHCQLQGNMTKTVLDCDLAELRSDDRKTVTCKYSLKILNMKIYLHRTFYFSYHQTVFCTKIFFFVVAFFSDIFLNRAFRGS